jgi:hypothetical protein
LGLALQVSQPQCVEPAVRSLARRHLLKPWCSCAGKEELNSSSRGSPGAEEGGVTVKFTGAEAPPPGDPEISLSACQQSLLGWVGLMFGRKKDLSNPIVQYPR